jgi:hypothetical protein
MTNHKCTAIDDTNYTHGWLPTGKDGVGAWICVVGSFLTLMDGRLGVRGRQRASVQDIRTNCEISLPINANMISKQV